MKLYVKLEPKNVNASEQLARCFFKVANSDSTFIVQGNEVEIDLKGLKDTEIFDTINMCKIKEAYITAEENEEFSISVSKKKELIKQLVPKVTGGEKKREVDQSGSEEKSSEYASEILATDIPDIEEARDYKKGKDCDISELNELAKESSSFDEFVNSVTLWIGIDTKRQDYFKSIVKKATEVNKIIWTNLDQKINSYERQLCTKAAKRKLGSSCSLLKLIKVIAMYKKYFDDEIGEKIVLPNVAVLDITSSSSITKTKSAETNAEEKNFLIPQLKEIADKADSFDKFLDSITLWLDLDFEKHKYFKDIISKALEMDKISIKDIDGKSFSGSNQNYTRAIRKALGNGWTFLRFIKEVVKYKDYFGNETEEVSSDFSEATSETGGSEAKEKAAEVVESEPISQNEEPIEKEDGILDIPNFKEILISINSFMPASERIDYVLNSMGLDKQNDRDINIITNIVNIALRMKNITMNVVFAKAENLEVSRITGEMILSSFVNGYVSKYNHKPVKALDFLKDLQSVIMNEDEIVN